jgi:tRNA G18 (ribose-2'-O)-methylase SpoU
MPDAASSGGFERILKRDDPRIADYRGVSEPGLLRSRNLFIAEGRLVVTRLLADPRWKVRSVLVSDAAARRLETALSAVPASVQILMCEAADFLGITGFHIHRGCLALVERPTAPALGPLLQTTRLAVVLEAVSNADNVGGVFRNAAAFGADAVLLSPECCSPLYRKAVRTSMGATLTVPFIHFEDSWPEALARLQQEGFTVVALVATPDRPFVETLEAFAARPRSAKLALLVGAEGSGLTAAAESAANHLVHIPMEAGIDSLNLTVATGIALEQLTRATRGRGILAGRIGP